MPPDDPGLPNDEELTQEQQTANDPQIPEGHVLVAVGDLPETFRSDETLVDSYKHAVRKINQQGQELRAERELREAAEARSLEQPQQQQPTYSPQQDPLVAAYEHAYQEGDATMMLAVQAELATRAAQQVIQQQPKPEPAGQPVDYDALGYQAEQAVWGQYGEEYAALRQQVAEKLSDHPELIADKSFTGLQKGIDLAYQLARGEKLAGDQRKAAQAEAEAETARREKRQAQTATGSGSRPAPPDETKATWARIQASDTGGFSTA